MSGPVGPDKGYRFSPSTEAEARAKRSRNNKRAIVFLVFIALVVIGANWNPPVGSIHYFTTLSDYHVSSDTGCTNSGKGCHGSETSYTNFNDYHPGVKCETCHDVKGAACIPCHLPNNDHECETCHDGSFERAPRTVRLTSDYPRGHYRATKHTATGTQFDTAVYASSTGDAKATCRDCHPQELRGAHADVAFTKNSAFVGEQHLACGQCHNDTSSGALRQVTSKWKSGKCEDCHGDSSQAPMHSDSVARAVPAVRSNGCAATGGGCHLGSNLHAIHANAPANCSGTGKRGGPKCHALGGSAAKPTARSCGSNNGGANARGCHPFDTAQHYNEPTHTATGDVFSSPVRAVAGGSAQATCAQCHAQDLRTAHTNVAPAPGSPYGTTVDCAGCHNDATVSGEAVVVAKWPTRTCEECHSISSAAPMHDSSVAPFVPANDPLGCGNTGVGCHTGANLHELHATLPSNCSGSARPGEPGCHVLGGDPLKPTATTCGGTGADSCHRVGASGTYDHNNSAFAHSPNNNVPASDTSYYAVACGSCHHMQPNGVSLIDEHGIPTSAKTVDPNNVCFNCHRDSASQTAIKNRWATRNTTSACLACHGNPGLPLPHLGDIVTLHSSGSSESSGCASSGAGCHPTSNLSEVGKPTVTANIHSTCLRCHDWRKANGDMAYDPSKKTCGSGRSCHGTDDQYDPATSVHNGSGGLVNGVDASHTAGSAQAAASWDDTASGTSTPCTVCHGMVLQTEHTRPNSQLATATPNACQGCHDHATSSATVVKGGWPKQGTSDACASCHSGSGVNAVHYEINTVMVGSELSTSGAPAPGTCVKAGCHQTTDLRVLHVPTGCNTVGCHQATGNINSTGKKSCGGNNPNDSCHIGFSSLPHAVDHTALPTGNTPGVSHGVTYTVGANIGCFGCHFNDLRNEHLNEFLAGAFKDSPNQVTVCETCHELAGDPNANPNSHLAGVKAAIKNHDHRCIACHASGNNANGPTYVASPHLATTVTATWDATSNIPPGYVWSNPADDWKTAFNGATGSGHNVLSAASVGASQDKAFPVTTFAPNAGSLLTTMTWTLPANSGATTWLRAGPLVSPTGTATVDEGWSVDTTTGIEGAHIVCSDCHALPANMLGPQGAAVTIYIDPNYSQTEYSNPTSGTYQFDPYNVDPAHPIKNPAGYKPVICYKCHQVFSGTVPGNLNPGGNGRHNTHKWHGAGTRQAYCVNCHVSIPHAWLRPRLLLRTAESTSDPGTQLDVAPYVEPDHHGLEGVKLVNLNGSVNMSSANCAVGGCYSGSSTATNHANPALGQTNGWSYWP